MTIEAMKQALAALETCRIRSVSEWEVSDVTPKNVTAAIQALRTAIQQAEAHAGEPVDFPAGAIVNGRTLMDRIEAYPFESQGGDIRMCSDWHDLRRCFEHLADYASHHPAPGVPDDGKRLDYLQDRGATIDLITGVADFYPMQFRVGGLHSSANTDVRAAIDAAMLTSAQAQKGQP